MAEPGWAGPGRFNTDFGYIVKNKHFSSISHIEKKSIVSEIPRCSKSSMTVERSSIVRAPSQ